MGELLLMQKWAFILLIGSLFPQFLWSNDLENHPTNLCALLPSHVIVKAQQGNAQAQFVLGMVLKEQKNIQDNSTLEAINFLRLAAKQNHIEAQVQLANLYITQDNYHKAAKWYEQAALLEDKTAQYTLANLYLNGKRVIKSNEKAVYWLKKSVAQNYPPAFVTMGILYFYGDGVSADHQKAQQLFAQAEELGFSATDGYSLLNAFNQALEAPDLLFKQCESFKVKLPRIYLATEEVNECVFLIIAQYFATLNARLKEHFCTGIDINNDHHISKIFNLFVKYALIHEKEISLYQDRLFDE